MGFERYAPQFRHLPLALHCNQLETSRLLGHKASDQVLFDYAYTNVFGVNKQLVWKAISLGYLSYMGVLWRIMSRHVNRWDHRLLFKIALFGGLSQLLLIPVFIIVGNLFGGREQSSGDLVVEEQVDAEDEVKSYGVYDQNGVLDAQLLLEANLQATYGSVDPGLHSLFMRGRLTLGNGEQADFSLMRRDDGRIREVAETAQIRFEYTSDGEIVRWIRSRFSQDRTINTESVSASLWYQARMAIGMPLGNLYGGDLEIGARRDTEEEYYVSWGDASVQQELWLDAQTLLVSKSRLIRDGLTYSLEFSEYREVDDMILPHRIDVICSDGRFPESIKVDQYQLNPGLPPSLFSP